MPNLHFILYFILFFALELIYFKIADRFNIIDKPNHRSSHTSITIRGGGIIFPLSILVYALFNDFQDIYFVVGLLAISTVSFLDDILTLNNKVRLSVHLTSVLLLFFQWDLFSLSWYWVLTALIFVIATINAYNFMDGINGITGGYSLLTVGTLYYINQNIISFTSNELLIIVGLALVVFNFFNFRKKAKCFAGDVGSVSIAFIIVFLIGQLILKTHNVSYIFLLLIYGTDTAFTVLFRKIRGENIFEAHRSHFYQYLSNQRKYSHLLVSFLYIVAQLLINVLLIELTNETMIYTLLLFFTFMVIYLFLRFKLEGKKRLLLSYDKHSSQM
ncbi:MraY family glycosyltransferase [Pedobacter chitinilyticus]|uniref:Glycosyltransferase family 4 protein n=1 Tax=Pedobacter chitinilyticus TaxID=2233776 RepID=A0A3S3PAN0_9SPHI|nr:glycosyltransferase family 4 protein [Pedobacter chitinilyticus]RWU05468.1 glycosyltransferase family 4 protein [Pedobacter chitinilyticus]